MTFFKSLIAFVIGFFIFRLIGKAIYSLELEGTILAFAGAFLLQLLVLNIYFTGFFINSIKNLVAFVTASLFFYLLSPHFTSSDKTGLIASVVFGATCSAGQYWFNKNRKRYNWIKSFIDKK